MDTNIRFGQYRAASRAEFSHARHLADMLPTFGTPRFNDFFFNFQQFSYIFIFPETPRITSVRLLCFAKQLRERAFLRFAVLVLLKQPKATPRPGYTKILGP